MSTRMKMKRHHPHSSDTEKNKRANLEKKYYIVAIITMVLSVAIALIALFLDSGKTETEINQGSDNQGMVINGDNNIINQSSLPQINENNTNTYSDPLNYAPEGILPHTADLMGQQKYSDAITYLSECLQRTDLSKEMRDCCSYNLGLCLLATGENDNLAASILSQVAKHAEKAEIYYYLCYVYFRTGQLNDAIAAIESAIELDSQEEYYILRDKLIDISS